MSLVLKDAVTEYIDWYGKLKYTCHCGNSTIGNLVKITGYDERDLQRQREFLDRPLRTVGIPAGWRVRPGNEKAQEFECSHCAKTTR